MQSAKSSILTSGSGCQPLTRSADTVCVRVCVAGGPSGRVEQGLGSEQVGNAKAFLVTTCCNHIWFCMSVDTVPASGWRFYKPKLLFFSIYYYLFIHPLCALSAFESLGCSQAAVLRDLQGTWLVLGQRVSSGALSSKKDLVSTSISECCLHMFGSIF